MKHFKPWKQLKLANRVYQSAEVDLEAAAEYGLTEWKRGVWQYLIDHTVPHQRGYVIRFVVRDEDDFWDRVNSRKTGSYTRNDPKVIGRKVQSLIWGSYRHSLRDKALAEARKSGSLYVKAMLYLRHLLNGWANRYAEDKVDSGAVEQLGMTLYERD